MAQTGTARNSAGYASHNEQTKRKPAKAMRQPQTQTSATPSRREMREKFNQYKSLMTISLIVVLCVSAVVLLYPSGREYYMAVRERDQLEAEYYAIADREAAIQKEIDALNSDAGVEKQARGQLGWVMEGENAVEVTGADSVSSTGLPAEIEKGSIEAPETWVTKILDVVFFVN